RSSEKIMSSDRGVFFNHMDTLRVSLKSNSMPRLSASSVRNIRPEARCFGVAASSATKSVRVAPALLSIVSETTGMPDGVSASAVAKATKKKRKARTALRMDALYPHRGDPETVRLVRMAQPLV